MIDLSDLKRKLRNRFRDEYGIQWSDDVLDGILREAQREYALYSGRVTGKFEVLTDERTVYTLPDDFFQVISVTGKDGKVIPVISYRKLIEKYGDFRKIKGERPEYICFNFDGFGKFRIFPQLPAGTYVGNVLYKRIPENDFAGLVNKEAIEQHAMFQMYQFTGKKLAQNCFKSFLDMVYREHNQGVTGGKNMLRTGVFF
jgi:hypothetical protein